MIPKRNSTSTNAQKEKEPQNTSTLFLVGHNNLRTLHSSPFRSVLFIMFLVFGLSLPALSGLLIFPFSLIPNNFWQIYAIILSIFFLTLTILFRRKEQYKSIGKSY
jgi:hypothetical protein